MKTGTKVALGLSAVGAVAIGIWLGRPQLIYQGEVVRPGAMRHVVGLVYGKREAECSGTLLTATIVLTAAHCMCQRWPSHVFVGDDISAREGPLSGLYHPVVDARSMLSCASQTSSTGIDMALLKLKNPVKNFTAPAFASDAIVDRASSYRVAGFGATNRAGDLFEFRKREATVPSLSNSCSQADAATYECQTGQEIVAGRRGGADSCSGDSGGPLLVSAKGDGGERSSDSLLLAGVVSRAVGKSETACGSGGIYERMRATNRDWIRIAIRSMGS